jgi:putative methyltransferase (TIGR04325 family)
MSSQAPPADAQSGTPWETSSAARPALVSKPNQTNTPRAGKKALIMAVLGIGPVRRLVDLGKPFAAYRNILNRWIPSWVKNRGVFASFEEARASVPSGIPHGYDHAEIASGYKEQADYPFPSDYPVMFWLREAAREGTRIFDFGGNLGISFYAWQNHMQFPNRMEWMVCDLPAVIQEGQKLALERNEPRLSFTSRFEEADGADFLLTSGTLQYIEAPFGEYLAKLKHLPRHLVVNRVPLHESRECVTLQNIRWMVSPYRVFQRERFIAEVASFGYRLVDVWADFGHSCWIPFYPEYSVEAYSGLYFRRD